jgi:hypothetical protein
VHELPLRDELFARRVVKMVPEGLDIVTDIAIRISTIEPFDRSFDSLDSHQTNTSQQTHEYPLLPKFDLVEQCQPRDICMV